MFLVIKFLGEVKILLLNYIWIILNCKWEKMPWHTLSEILGSPLSVGLDMPFTCRLGQASPNSQEEEVDKRDF